MTAVIALAAAHVGSHHDAVAHLQRNSFEIYVVALASNGRNRADILVPLNDGKFQRTPAVLRRVALKRVFVRSANPGQFHLDQNTARLRLRQRILAQLVMPWFHQRCGKNVLNSHVSTLCSLRAPVRTFSPNESSLILEVELERQLADSGLRRTSHLAEIRRVSHACSETGNSDRRQELRVID